MDLLSELHVLVVELVWRLLVGLGHVVWRSGVGWLVSSCLNKVPLGVVLLGCSLCLVVDVSVGYSLWPRRVECLDSCVFLGLPGLLFVWAVPECCRCVEVVVCLCSVGASSSVCCACCVRSAGATLWGEFVVWWMVYGMVVCRLCAYLGFSGWMCVLAGIGTWCCATNTCYVGCRDRLLLQRRAECFRWDLMSC